MTAAHDSHAPMHAAPAGHGSTWGEYLLVAFRHGKQGKNMQRTYLQCCLAIFMGLAGIGIVAGCAEHPDMVGVYQEVSGAAPGSSSILKLEENKEGIWETNIDEISFRWSVKGQELWLHTKTGGVIIGRIIDQGFIIELPETGSFVFHRRDP